MPRLDVTIKTHDGSCPASVFTPSVTPGPWPGVLFFMDGLGIRPALWEMGQRLADGGYLVLLPDLYYRNGSYPPMNPARVFVDSNLREELKKFIASLTRDRKISDAGAFIEFLTARTDVKGNRFGATGYCMGGNVALTAGGAFPDRFAAVASFHGGRVYVAGAIEDTSFPDEQKNLLEKTLTEGGVSHLIETYSDAHHGFAVADHPAFNPTAAERHWVALFRLLRETLAV